MIILGLIVGVAIDSARGLLLAPEKAQILREKLNENLKATSDDLKVLIDTQIERLKERFDKPPLSVAY